MVCDAESCGNEGKFDIARSKVKLFASGTLTSPNYPQNYPHNLWKTDMIKVKEGQIIVIHFNAFNVQVKDNKCHDHLEIIDGDGSTLMRKTCRHKLLVDIISRSNIVKLHFRTSSIGTRPGWSLTWTAMIQGE